MKPLYILLEGNDDERFFDRVLSPHFRALGYKVYLWKYACEKRRTTIQFLKFLKARGYDFIFVRDIDNSPSIEAKMEELVRSFEGLTRERIAVVVMEIESWYLAGAEEGVLKRYGICHLHIQNTDSLTKEEFNRLVPRRLSKVVFMHEILKRYRMARARERNRSFRHFTDRWLGWDMGQTRSNFLEKK